MSQRRQQAFGELCSAEYEGIVRTAFLMTGDRDEAVDLAQETFARAYAHWSTVSTLDRPGAWLQRVAANLAISWIRRAAVRRRGIPTDRPATTSIELPDPELIDALRSLSPAQRAVVALRFYADRSVEETAAILGKRPGTVRALTSQALARLRLVLDREEVSP